ncbi:hypothetical protein BCU53_024390 (plasmid) [Vibrio lentus]|uniref:hypothetical protein n=1 Tax=Vibrio lentus TaxID=136468 RepID=UPI000C81F288|nr:hypothetical protein [Vibrio lentus]PMI07847.1 hypothetical protein BCU53_10085 [Vibrio lentus]
MQTYNIEDIVSGSIMTKTPVIIVEGIDDMPVYKDIAVSIDIEAQVLASELIKDGKSGCEGVKELMADIDALPESRYDYKDYIVGIIDKDVTDYRGEIPDYKCLFPLRYYSMESHFVCETTVLDLLKSSTKTTNNLLDERVKGVVTSSIMNSLNRLYLVSLEALQGALDSEYDSLFSYSCTSGRAYCDENLFNQISDKKAELESFAQSKGIEFDLESMRKFIKGKWLLDIYFREFDKALKTLPQFCESGEIIQCEFCMVGVADKCSYTIKNTITPDALRTLAMTSTDNRNFDYIKDKFRQLKQK